MKRPTSRSAILLCFLLAFTLPISFFFYIINSPQSLSSSSSTSFSTFSSHPAPLRPPYSHPHAPAWQNFSLLLPSTHLSSSPNLIAPFRLTHLLQSDLPSVFRNVFIVSAFLDPRPSLLPLGNEGDGDQQKFLTRGRTKELQILTVVPAGISMKQYWASTPLDCVIAIRKTAATSKVNWKGGRREKGSKEREEIWYGRRKASASPLPDSRMEEKDWTGSFFVCSMEFEDGDDYNLEIFVTLAPPSHEPPSGSFIPVRVIPLPPTLPPPPLPTTTSPLSQPLYRPPHVVGSGGITTLCLQPMVSDKYATSLEEWLAYYTALGVDHFYMYLLDPGPQTLAILRMLKEQEMIKRARGEKVVKMEFIRWTLPKEWLETRGKYEVDPRDWGLDNITYSKLGEEIVLGAKGEWDRTKGWGRTVMSDEEEEGYAYSGSDPPKADVKIWAFGQNVAHHDCRMRSLAIGARWTTMVDLDEYLVLRPPHGVWPPLVPDISLPSPLTVADQSPITHWAYTLPPNSSLPNPGHNLLPAGVVFRSAFLCAPCLPSHYAPPTTELRSIKKSLADFDERRPTPDVPLVWISPVRHGWFRIGLRTKSILDPWAWHTGNFHYPEMSYATYAGLRCAGPGFEARSSSDQEVAAAPKQLANEDFNQEDFDPKGLLLPANDRPNPNPVRKDRNRIGGGNVHAKRAILTDEVIESTPSHTPSEDGIVLHDDNWGWGQRASDRSPLGTTCEEFFQELFGVEAVVVDTPPPPYVGPRVDDPKDASELDNSPRLVAERERLAQQGDYEHEQLGFATGAMYHARAYAPHLRLVLAWAAAAAKVGASPEELLTHSNGTNMFRRIRLPERAWENWLKPGPFPGDPVEDWNVMTVMGGVLRDILEKRKAEGVWRWDGMAWVNGRDTHIVEQGGGNWLVRGAMAGLVAMILLGVMRRRSRSRGGGERLHLHGR